MHETVVELKDGRVICGYIYEKRSQDGYITLMAADPEEFSGQRLLMEDMESCITKGERISVNKIGDYDELEDWRQLQLGS